MTTHESFKKRIRARMARTGERYNAARRALLTASAPTGGTPGWAAEPEMSDERIRTATGHGWNEWVTLVDGGPGRDAGHTAIATWVRDDRGVDGWWAQSVTVGYERITGLRMPGQMPDGTFTVSRSRTLDLGADELRGILLDDAARADLLPGLRTTLRSKPTAKALRFAVADAETGDAAGVVLFSPDPVGDRIRLTVSHEKLGSVAAGEVWKGFWADWLASLDE